MNRLTIIIMILALICLGVFLIIKEKNNPTLEALKHSDLETLASQMEAGADPNQLDKHKQPLAYHAIKHDDVEALKLLFKYGAKHKANEYETLLHTAASSNAPNCAELLISLGANVHAQDRSGATALKKAVTERSLKIIRLLIDHGSDVDATDDKGSTILRSAIESQSPYIVEIILSKGAKVDPEDALAAAKMHLDETTLLLLRSGQPHTMTLHEAAYNDLPMSAHFLISKGQDVNMRNAMGQTPLMTTAIVNAYKTARVLIDAGADPRLKSSDDSTAYTVALKNRAPDVAHAIELSQSR